MAKRPNKRELLMRETKCLEGIGAGLTREQNLDMLVAEFNITHETAEKLYFEVTRKVSGLREASFEELKAQILCQMDIIYKRCMDKGNYKTALDTLMSKTKVSGLAEASIMNQGEDKSAKLRVIEIKEKDFSEG